MFHKVKTYKGLDNDNIRLDVKNLNLRYDGWNICFNIKNNNKSETIDIPIYNFIDILSSFNVLEQLNDEIFIIAKDVDNYLTNPKMNNYKNIIEDFKKQEFYKRKTTKYQVGNIYGSKTRQYIYLGELFYYIKIPYDAKLCITDLPKYIVTPEKYHILLPIERIKKNYLCSCTNISTLIDCIFDNNLFILKGHQFIFKNKLSPTTEIKIFEQDIDINNIDFSDKFYKLIKNLSVKLALQNNINYLDHLNLEWIFLSQYNNQKDTITNRTIDLCNLLEKLRSYNKNTSSKEKYDFYRINHIARFNIKKTE